MIALRFVKVRGRTRKAIKQGLILGSILVGSAACDKRNRKHAEKMPPPSKNALTTVA
jgi:hypothetical protein